MDSRKRELIINNVDLVAYLKHQGYNCKKSGGNKYLVTPCPMCGSEKHKDDQGHFYVYDRKTFNSFTGCCNGGNIIDYLEQVERLPKNEAISMAEQLAGLTGDYEAKNRAKSNETIKNSISTHEKEKESTTADFKTYYEKLKKGDSTPAKSYLISRGIDKNIDWVLYDRELGSVIFPVSDSCYIYRNLNSNKKGFGKGSQGDIYGRDLLQSDIISIFITEGIIDGLSTGKPFISLNGVSLVEKLLEVLKESLDTIKDKLFILALDNDKAGIEATTQLKEGMDKLKIKHVIFSFNREYKDLNEYKLKDSLEFSERMEIEDYLKPYEDYLMPDLVSSYLDDFMVNIKANKDKKAISTGFPGLDRELGGGLYPGLYVIGAISSLGKTTLIQQITDRIAQRGDDVLFFSLEMSRFEMVGKSLSRLTYENEYYRKEALTTREVLTGVNSDVLAKGALQNYKPIACNLSIIEGAMDMDLNDVRQKIERYVKYTGRHPVAVIDYLQILQAGRGGIGTDKQKIDYVVTELKRISRDNNIPFGS